MSYFWRNYGLNRTFKKGKQKLRCCWWAVLGMVSMRRCLRLPLETEEAASLQMAYETFDHDLVTVDKLQRLLINMGITRSVTELTQLLERHNWKDGDPISFDVVVSILEVLKRRTRDNQVPATVEAFAALGGNSNGSGGIPVEQLQTQLDGFELNVCLEDLLLGVHDTNKNHDLLDYSEFMDVFDFSEQPTHKKARERKMRMAKARARTKSVMFMAGGLDSYLGKEHHLNTEGISAADLWNTDEPILSSSSVKWTANVDELISAKLKMPKGKQFTTEVSARKLDTTINGRNMLASIENRLQFYSDESGVQTKTAGVKANASKKPTRNVTFIGQTRAGRSDQMDTTAVDVMRFLKWKGKHKLVKDALPTKYSSPTTNSKHNKRQKPENDDEDGDSSFDEEDDTTCTSSSGTDDPTPEHVKKRKALMEALRERQRNGPVMNQQDSPKKKKKKAVVRQRPESMVGHYPGQEALRSMVMQQQQQSRPQTAAACASQHREREREKEERQFYFQQQAAATTGQHQQAAAGGGGGNNGFGAAGASGVSSAYVRSSNTNNGFSSSSPTNNNVQKKIAGGHYVAMHHSQPSGQTVVPKMSSSHHVPLPLVGNRSQKALHVLPAEIRNVYSATSKNWMTSPSLSRPTSSHSALAAAPGHTPPARPASPMLANAAAAALMGMMGQS
eukprot:TRINITY_DN57687_c0_g1_i1.p1 TRINITY_DN57687_c0_g1~~TRINITY_DN57687_c0_g1_i1.p1  ORF type:complete len:675 (+),score=48.63 TRINITY_DN57687_c0_g1_i1:800-2824(+)